MKLGVPGPLKRLRTNLAPENDLGFGNRITNAGERLINRDGSLNIKRTGLYTWTPYQSLIEMSWSRFFLLLLLVYLSVNAVFGCLFMFCGVNGFSGITPGGPWAVFQQLFFFSVQTFTTVGYGSISPDSTAANIVATLDAFIGLLSFALATGLLFARFSKPRAQILFSDMALIAPYQDGKSFQFRIANRRNNKIINLHARLFMTWVEATGNEKRRHFQPLTLEREKVAIFPLNWTIVHPIAPESPLWNRPLEKMIEEQAEFIILLQGYDETFAQDVHANGSYLATDIIKSARFDKMYFSNGSHTELELDKISSITLLTEKEEEE